MKEKPSGAIDMTALVAGVCALGLPALLIDLLTGEVHASAPFRRLLGVPPEETLTLSVLRESTPVSDLVVEAESLSALRTGRERAVSYQKRYLTRSGTVVPAFVHAFCLECAEAPRWLVVLVLVAGSESALTPADDAASLADHLFYAIPVPLVVWRLSDGEVVYANNALAALTGRTPASIVGRDFADAPLTRPEDRKRMAAELSRSGKVRDLEVRYTDETGRERIGSLSSVSYASKAGELIITAVHDLTERRELEGQLLQAQKMEAVGQLAGGIAHDFNNLLTAIGGHAELLLSGTPSPDGLRAAAEVIRDASDRASGLTRQLLDFARCGTNRVAPVHLRGIVDSVRRLVAPSLGGAISIEASCTAGRPIVRGDPSQLEQVLVNLIMNARDAMQERGGVIRVRLEDSDQRGSVRLEVADTGHGISPEHLPHLFEPFFTTKARGVGTGLGLAAVYGIVRQHQGSISVDSQLGAGTRFRIELPITEETAAPPRSLTPLGLKARDLVLLVDDDPLVRNLTERMLERLGRRVVVAEDGAAAVAAYRALASPPAAVLLDVVMPVMDGPACLTELLKIDPNARVIVCTGYAGEQRVQRMLDAGAVGFLQKPYSPAELFDALGRALS